MKYIISVLVALVIFGSPGSLVADDSYKWPYIPDLQYVAREMADQYGVKDYSVMAKVIDCESNWNPETKGDKKDGMYLAVNVAQFHKETFQNIAIEMGEPNLNWDSAYDQIKVMAYAFSKGESYRKLWTTYRAIKNGGVYSFHSTQLKMDFTVKCKMI